MGKIEKYLGKINEYAKEINWDKTLDGSYKTRILEDMVQFFTNVYGTDFLTGKDCEEDDGFAEVPGTILANDGTEYVVLLSLNIIDSGEHYGTTLIHPKYGFIRQEEFNSKLSKEEISEIIPYRYRPHIFIPNDCHQGQRY
ncbi:MAG: hypothetical protein ACOCRX_01320 [Candidatus Woesearchaeota archaeon]